MLLSIFTVFISVTSAGPLILYVIAWLPFEKAVVVVLLAVLVGIPDVRDCCGTLLFVLFL